MSVKRVIAILLATFVLVTGCGKTQTESAASVGNKITDTEKDAPKQESDSNETTERYLDELEGSTENRNVICESQSKIDGKDFIITLYETNDSYEISVLGLAENEEKATILLASCNEQLAKLYDAKFCESYSVGVCLDDKMAMILVNHSGKIASGINSDGSAVSGKLPDWIVENITMPESESNAYNDEILNALKQFADEMQTSLK